jgi:hypothetical protein
MGRKSNIVDRCPHVNLKHYAKGMCNHCYHKYGRDKLAEICGHSDRPAYAKGKCQKCYINDFNRNKRSKANLLKSKKPENTTSQLENLVRPSPTIKRAKLS